MFCISENFDCPIETIRDTTSDVVLAATKASCKDEAFFNGWYFEKGEAEISKSKQWNRQYL